MNPNDAADATVRALDLLPPGDPAASDPRLVRDPGLIRAAREARETAAYTWLAESPLRAAPEDLLPSILERIAGENVVRPPRRFEKTVTYLFAASGWAAPAVLLLWPRVVRPVGQGGVPVAGQVAEEDTPSPSPPRPSTAGPRTKRGSGEIARLRAKLAALSSANQSVAPKIISLNAPDAPPRDPEEVRKRVRTILTNALRAAIEAETGTPADSAAWVIERGWPGNGILTPPADGYIRHRNFPEARWEELGLLASPDGTYYDPANQSIWMPDPDGSGFIGRTVASGEDLSGFSGRSEGLVRAPASGLPEGFLIQNPADGTAELVLGGLPPQPPNTVRNILITDAGGNVRQIPLEPSAPGEPGLVEGSFYYPSARITINLGTGSTIASLKVMEHSGTEPPRVLIGGSP